MKQDKIIEILDKLEKKKHKFVSDYHNDKLIRLWKSEIYNIIRDCTKQENMKK